MSWSGPSRPRRERIDARSQVSPRRSDGSRAPVGPHLGSIRLTPTRVTLGVALFGSALYLLFAITVRDASQIPMLASGAGILGIVFGALAVAGGVSTYRAGAEGRTARALGMALAGGLAGMIAAGCIAVAIVLALAWR